MLIAHLVPAETMTKSRAGFTDPGEKDTQEIVEHDKGNSDTLHQLSVAPAGLLLRAPPMTGTTARAQPFPFWTTFIECHLYIVKVTYSYHSKEPQ